MSTARKIEGIDFVYDGRTKAGSRSRRRPTYDELTVLGELSARYQAESDAIRAAAGLDPVPPNSYRRALAIELERRAPKPAAAKAPRRVVSLDKLRALAAEQGFELVPVSA